jgi:hypothetical protein
MEMEMVINAPDVFAKPYERSLLFRRDRQHEFHEETWCVGYDRFGDVAAGKHQEINWSGREDLNLRPLAPHASALPGCATPRP